MRALKKADIYLIISIILMLIYTATSIVIQAATGYTNDTLTTCFFTAFGTEIASCCVIKVFNIKHESDDNIDEGGVG